MGFSIPHLLMGLAKAAVMDIDAAMEALADSAIDRDAGTMSP